MIREKIKQARLKADMTQGQLAEKAGCRTATISDLERGKASAGSELLDKICQVLQLKLI
ncbi:MAG: helix-turn-helix transcriptional regulator [Bacteroidetes bacterium]|nr:helix-turn-helix transcriptional regulator [Bacteroidota bacterium]